MSTTTMRHIQTYALTALLGLCGWTLHAVKEGEKQNAITLDRYAVLSKDLDAIKSSRFTGSDAQRELGRLEKSNERLLNTIELTIDEVRKNQTDIVSLDARLEWLEKNR